MKMSFKEFLKEAPLPADWDKSTYTQRSSFASRIKYAKERAAHLGAGSSRVAFRVPYEGRDTVLKIAKNAKGMAQNEHEAQALEDYYLQGLGIVIPMIDYDTESAQPTWLHMEMAAKAKPSDFKRLTGGTPSDLVAYAQKLHGKKVTGWGGNPSVIDPESETVQAFVDYAGSYDHTLADYVRLANWGLYDGRLVIIDVGLSDDIFKMYYLR